MSVDYAQLTPTSVRATVPDGVGNYAGQQIAVSLTSGTVTGATTDLAVAP